MNGQNRIHSKLDIKQPVLVMHSNCSVGGKDWKEDYMRCDGVLNVDLIKEWAPYLGDKVTTRTIQDGMHDLFLSRKNVRDGAYREMFDFIDEHVK
jgi:alpha-beta hydrolase superfamily lysophospholipase